MEWGVGPGAVCHSEKTVWEDASGAGPLSGRVARGVIQNWPYMLSAPRRAWNRHANNGALHGLAVAPGQPVVSYVCVGRHAPDQVRDVAPNWPAGFPVSFPASLLCGRRPRRRARISRLPACSFTG
jgi:hypothetical protein